MKRFQEQKNAVPGAGTSKNGGSSEEPTDTLILSGFGKDLSSMNVKNKCVLNADADYCMKCTQTGFESYGDRCWDKLYIKAWQMTGKLFAVTMCGSDHTTIMDQEQFGSLFLDEIAFFGAVVYAGRSLLEGQV